MEKLNWDHITMKIREMADIKKISRIGDSKHKVSGKQCFVNSSFEAKLNHKWLRKSSTWSIQFLGLLKRDEWSGMEWHYHLL